jgi:predicted transposase YdaD
MDGPQPAGPTPAIDHDRLFKELLTTFFVEFIDLFFPKLAAQLDRESIEFLSQEHFIDLLDGDKYHADIVVKARFKEAAAFFLIHVEHQSTAPSTFPRRFLRYFSAIFERHGLPVYPIVIYSHDRPKKAQPSVYRVDFPDGEVLRFHYRVVQLNRLSWRKFIDSHNPVASALMAKMKIAERDRPKVKAECLRLMVTLKLDRARMGLIASFVDTYLGLNAAEEMRFNRALTEAQWLPEQKEEVVEIVTSWERKGIEKGLQEGLVKGRQEGRQEGRMEGLEAIRAVLLDVLTTRFGQLNESVTGRVRGIGSMEELRSLTHRALSAGSLNDVGL